MEENIDKLRKNVKKLLIKGELYKIITLLTDELLETQKDAELYLLRGNTWYKKKDYDKAIIDYNKAIEINPENEEVYLLRGNTRYKKKDYDKAIIDYNKAIENNPENEEVYILRGNSWYFKEDNNKAMTYNNAIEDYEKAITINPDYTLAFYNKAQANVARKKYKDAIRDFNKVICLDPNYTDIYVSRGNIKRVHNGDYDGAIADYTDALKININDENAYYYRGLGYYNKALNRTNIDLIKSKQDFEKYLTLTNKEKNNDGEKYAKLYIEELNEVINDPDLWSIKQLVNNIKVLLWIREENCITHYTSLSVLKDLIFDDSKFRISEGNFMNDPSEGKEFFKFIKYKPNTFSKNSLSIDSVSSKPFIGSFVTKDNGKNLNMWRFYGKEKGEEAKGCAITLRTDEFIENIENCLSNEKNKEARLDNESDIKFYRVVYVVHNGATNFYIPNSDKDKKLESLMIELTEKIKPYEKNDNRTYLEKYLNSIAFLFKNEAYKNEEEVRLVMNGIEFKKKYNMCVSSPRVYIELVPIKDIVSQIILGPKVDKGSEWITAFHYRYERSAPKIKFSRLPYK